MNSKIMKCVKPIAFLLIGVLMFSLVQEVFIPASSRKRENADRIIDGLGRIEKGVVDVIFVGSSLIEYGVSPVRLYEKTGICSYSLATSGQPITVAYWLIRMPLRSRVPP